jgi:hypothetical protein
MQQQPPLTAKKSTLFLPVTSKGEGISGLEGLESSFWGQIGVEFEHVNMLKIQNV